MVKPLQRVALGFPLCIISIAALSFTISRQPPRSVAGFLLPFLFPVLLIAFGGTFLGAFSRALLSPSHPILRFALPIFLSVVLLASSLFIGIWLARLFHWYVP
jgi:hypothetical protein